MAFGCPVSRGETCHNKYGGLEINVDIFDVGTRKKIETLHSVLSVCVQGADLTPRKPYENATRGTESRSPCSTGAFTKTVKDPAQRFPWGAVCPRVVSSRLWCPALVVVYHCLHKDSPGILWTEYPYLRTHEFVL